MKNTDKIIEEGLARRSRLEKTTIKRRLERDKIRKEIGKKEGVNYKRVVLVSKVEKGKFPLFTIK